MNNLEALRDRMRDNFALVLPIAMIVLVGIGDMVMGAVVILPQVQSYDQLSADLETSEAQLQEAEAEQADAPAVLQAQIDSAQSELDEVATLLLTDFEADQVTSSLYRYANESGVEIVDLQVQPTPAEVESSPYSLQMLRLQVDGTPPQLMDFVARIREAAAPSVDISALSLVEGETLDTLTLDLHLYTSPYATGDALTNLPSEILPTPIPVMPTATPETVVAEEPTIAQTPVLTATPTMTPTITPTTAPDGTLVGPGVYNDDHEAVRYVKGTWTEITSQSGYGGNYHYSEDTDAELQFSFVGTDVAVQFVGFVNFGIFELYIDDALWGEVDGYAPEGTFGQLVYINGLQYGMHALTVRNTGRRNESSEGFVLALDAFHVIGANSQEP